MQNIIIHDGARPFVKKYLFEKIIEQNKNYVYSQYICDNFYDSQLLFRVYVVNTSTQKTYQGKIIYKILFVRFHNDVTATQA